MAEWCMVVIKTLFGFFVRLVTFAVLAELVHLQTHLQLWVAGGVVVVLAALGALEANHGFLWHIGMGNLGLRADRNVSRTSQPKEIAWSRRSDLNR